MKICCEKWFAFFCFFFFPLRPFFFLLPLDFTRKKAFVYRKTSWLLGSSADSNYTQQKILSDPFLGQACCSRSIEASTLLIVASFGWWRVSHLSASDLDCLATWFQKEFAFFVHQNEHKSHESHHVALLRPSTETSSSNVFLLLLLLPLICFIVLNRKSRISSEKKICFYCLRCSSFFFIMNSWTWTTFLTLFSEKCLLSLSPFRIYPLLLFSECCHVLCDKLLRKKRKHSENR